MSRQLLARLCTTFGFAHANAVNGFTYDKDVVVKMTAPDPRAEMLRMFGQRWSMEYRTLDELHIDLYPRGVKEITV